MTDRKQRAAQLKKVLADQAKRRKIRSTNDSPQYVTYKHPEQLFEIDYPAHWRVLKMSEEELGSIRFVPPENLGAGMDIFQASVPVDTETMAATGKFEMAMQEMLKLAGSIEFSTDPTIVYPNVVGNRTEEEQLGKRHIIMAADVYIGISTSLGHEDLETYQPILERMLASFRVRRQEYVLAGRMVQAALKRLKEELPNVAFEHDGKLKLLSQSPRFELSLGNLFAQIQQSPAQFHEHIEQMVQGIKGTYEQINKIGKQTWDDVRHQIQPLIRQDKYVQQMNLSIRHKSVGRKEDSDVAHVPSIHWLADLCICYGIDEQRTFRMVNGIDLQRWGVSMEELHRVAMENLNGLPEPEMVVIGVSESMPKLAGMNAKQGATSSCVLRNDFYQKATAAVGPNPLIALPSRDALMIFGEGHKRESIERAVLRDFEQTSHPLSDRLFRATPDGIVLS